jgi:uncharacterized membrane protein SirB2
MPIMTLVRTSKERSTASWGIETSTGVLALLVVAMIVMLYRRLGPRR